MFGILGAPLFREHTCMDGGYCDFKLKLGAEPLPYWPPVFTQANDSRYSNNEDPRCPHKRASGILFIVAALRCLLVHTARHDPLKQGVPRYSA